ncbi:fibrous sheath CABYR-binding protein-like [Papaver somniferum]|uniref:fibrous sheath CABYR-binding protein-like n=1 Tax=Papaver somniferum TaxID=3469 RepID=UPI000E6F95C1|nr:fibrous sheath CABYR-binding protein-like [Papaver somniferum]
MNPHSDSETPSPPSSGEEYDPLNEPVANDSSASVSLANSSGATTPVTTDSSQSDTTFTQSDTTIASGHSSSADSEVHPESPEEPPAELVAPQEPPPVQVPPQEPAAQATDIANELRPPKKRHEPAVQAANIENDLRPLKKRNMGEGSQIGGQGSDSEFHGDNSFGPGAADA